MDEDTSGPDEGVGGRLSGRVLADRYRVVDVVSSGANTIIVDAIDSGRPDGDVPVTIKIVNPERVVDTAFRDDFRRQVQIAMSLSHPNIAAVQDWGEIELDGSSTLFWVVDHLDGGSLRDLYDRGRLLEPSQALVVGLEACRALDAAHSRGVVHSELTPSKMVFGSDGRLRVIDFAMARLLGRDAWEDPATVATHVARYASPEQSLGLDVEPKSDVYALALCLIEGITGTVPFAGDSTVSTLAARVGRLMPVTADMGSLASVLERAGRPDAEDRWTAEEFGEALVQAAAKLPRPEPIPILASSLFAASVAQARSGSGGPPAGPADGRTSGLDAPPGGPDALAADDTDDLEMDDVEMDDVDRDAGEAGVVGEVALAAGLGVAAVDADGNDTATGDATGEASGADDDAVEDDTRDEAADAGGAPDPDAAPSSEGVPSATGLAAPLVLLTDIADPPTGAVQVGGEADSIAGPPSGPPNATGLPEPTAELPAAAAAVIDPTPSGTLYDEERAGRRWFRTLAIALVILVGIVALGYAGWLLLRTKSYEVPDLVGVDEAVALNEIAGNGWVVETERERSDAVPEEDHVVRTIPVAGEQLDEGATFVIVVSDGPELRTIPELAGMTLVDAQATLEDLRLLVVEAPPVYSETVPAGAVVGWQVEGNTSLVAGAQVLPETTIVLTVSLGPEPRPAPDLTGQTVDEATATLAELQLAIERGEDEFSSTIEVGRVVSQDPPPATPVERDAAVTVRVSKGPDLVPIPDLAGQTYPQAQQTLADAGFVIDSLLGTTEGTFVSVSVDGEEVQAGATFPRGTGVDLIFL